MTTWTPEATDTLKAFWTEGLSASTIALRLPGAHVTRNAVLGKVHRLHLERRAPSPGGRVAQTREERNAKARSRRAADRIAAGGPHMRHIVRKIVALNRFTATIDAPIINGHKPSLAPINGKARHMKPRLWKARHASPVPAPAYAGEPVPITEATGCRYIEGDSKLCCNAPGFPWCEFHKAIVWRPL